MFPLYLSLRRHYLEHHAPFWASHLVKDMEWMEKFLRKATKNWLGNTAYRHRWNQQQLLDLQNRLNGKKHDSFQKDKNVQG